MTNATSNTVLLPDEEALTATIEAVHNALDHLGEVTTEGVGDPYVAGLLTPSGVRISILISLTQ